MKTNISIFFLRHIALVWKTLSWFPEFQMRLRHSFPLKHWKPIIFLLKRFKKKRNLQFWDCAVEKRQIGNLLFLPPGCWCNAPAPAEQYFDNLIFKGTRDPGWVDGWGGGWRGGQVFKFSSFHALLCACQQLSLETAKTMKSLKGKESI